LKKLLRSMLAGAAVLGLGAGCLLAQADPQAKILSYIRDHLKAGQPVRVTDLYNTVFTSPEDHAALSKLYKDFFRIPTFVVQYQQRFSVPPSLRTIAEQFSLKDPEEADTLLRVMETDPRVPKFITRDSATGEITKVDVEKIRNDPRFSAGATHELGGWIGKTAPSFSLAGAGNKQITSAGLGGKVALLYVWFTGCPPCMKEAPELARVQRDLGAKGFEVVGANADDLLGLDVGEEARQRYAEKEGITFPIVSWNKDSNQAYGGISIYPTLFLINRQGTITGHWVGFTSPATLREAIAKAMAGPSGKH
jgi:peroxiredoxin